MRRNLDLPNQTVFAQILSSRLGVALEAIEIVEGDTARIARGTGTVRILRYTAVDDVGNVINPVIVEGRPFDLNPLGAKDAGEAGTIAAPAALVSAVLDALRANGVNDLEMPLPPARVWGALPRRARA